MARRPLPDLTTNQITDLPPAPQEYAAARESFLRNGLASPMNYYKSMVFDLNIEDNKGRDTGLFFLFFLSDPNRNCCAAP